MFYNLSVTLKIVLQFVFLENLFGASFIALIVFQSFFIIIRNCHELIMFVDNAINNMLLEFQYVDIFLEYLISF